MVRGILTEADCQLVFVDPPGLFTPSNLLQRSMVDTALQAMRDSDMVLQLQPANQGDVPPIEELAPEFTPGDRPCVTVLTKIDLARHAHVPTSRYPTIPVSAVTGQGLEELKRWCRDRAPPGPFRYDAEDLSTQDLRFFVAELIREVAFELLEQELPYALATEVDEFREQPKPVYIRVVIYVERSSQKGMVIGRDGRIIKEMGRLARTRIEALLGEQVYLDLWVKVLPKWRTNANALRMLGLPTPTEKRDG